MTDVTVKQAYEGLCNAICAQAIRDYEAAISERPMPDFISLKDVNKRTIEIFAKEQTLTSLDMTAMLEQTLEDYEDKFIPFIKRNLTQIIEDFKKYEHLRKRGGHKFREKYKWRCPHCGGILIFGPRNSIMKNYISCTYCQLCMKLPKGVKV